MCGIGGKLYFDPARPVEREVLERMNVVQAHRGPDDAGIYCQGSVGLAHRRLSIIDPSPAGHQPMPNEDGTVWIVFNGEIYNFQDLRPDLLGRGHRFRSRTDTEVILHLVAQSRAADVLDGIVEALQQVRGAYSLVLMNHTEIFAARDPHGFRPLCLGQLGDGYVVASETCALDLIEATYLRDVVPGELIRISAAGLQSYLQNLILEEFLKFEKLHLEKM
jgi:asparagine synthase (glutamine-hydrolysing)